ncbi:hypothetical protein [Brevibacillus brevis]|uniref:hypothetical protein n=2 Tax=Brevibacillus brevis TaxID=1393 RepID=UPI001E6166D9|nr:hypothetical protein [Brevibacillus brevis]
MIFTQKIKNYLLATLVLGVSITSLSTFNTVLAKKEVTSIEDLENYAVEKNVNIMLYDENGKIENEFHADGLEVTYEYKNGKMKSSKDNKGKKQIYIANDDFVEVVEYENDKEIYRRGLSFKQYKFPDITPEERKKLDQEKIQQAIELDESLSPLSTTSYENYYVNGVLMNDIAVSRPNSSTDYFTYAYSMSESEIQQFFETKNSILKSSVQIWKKDSSGNVYNTGRTIVPSKAIATAATTHFMNPKVIIAALQKESSLVSAAPGTVSYSSRRFYYAMGYGATDSGDINGTSGFDVQIDKGTKLFKDLWAQAPVTQPALFSGINYNKTVTSNGVTYKNYIWTKNWGTWALYKYTPHSLDINLLPTIGGGNYLFYQIFKGYWGTDWT